MAVVAIHTLMGYAIIAVPFGTMTLGMAKAFDNTK